jgi:hypothetical protein
MPVLVLQNRLILSLKQTRFLTVCGAVFEELVAPQYALLMLSRLEGVGRRRELLEETDNSSISSELDAKHRWLIPLYLVFGTLTLVEGIILYPILSWNPLPGGDFVYLTYIHLLMQSCYWILALIDEWIRTRHSAYHERLHWHRCNAFAAFMFPLGIFVTLGFYSLIHQFGSSWLDLIRSNFDHGIVTVFICIELYLTPHKYWPKQRKFAQSMQIAVFAVVYILWTLLARILRGQWTYPFESQVSTAIRDVLFVVLCFVCWSMYFVGRFLNRVLHENKGAAERDIVET